MLYVTDLKECDPPFGVFKELLPLRKKLFDRVVFALPASPAGREADLTDLEISFKTRTIRNFSGKQIMAAAREEGVSLIVIDLDEASRGAALRELTSKSPLPVLAMNRNASGSGLLDHVIFATDWSPASEKAMERILALGELIYELDIIHVISEKLTVKDMRELKERLERTRRICLDEGINAESHIYAGDVAEEIVTASEDYRGTMIAVGSGTERPFLKRILGRDMVCTIIKDAAVPVLFVPVAAPTSRD